MSPRRISVTGIVTTAGGLALLVWVVSRVGLSQIAGDVRQVGWGLVAIITIGGLRFLARAVAWRLCMEPGSSLPLGTAFAAVICGDAIGNLTPLGPIVGEPAKAAFVRTRVPLGPAATALAIENILYTLSAAAMIAAGMIALLFGFELPAPVRDIGQFAIAGTVALFAVALLLLWRQPALISRALGLAPRLQRHGERARQLEQQMYSFASRRLRVLPGLIATETAFHVLGVAEVHVTLWLFYGVAPALLTSFVFEATNRLITVVFKFVPLRLGVDEAATALFSQVLGLGANTGVSLSIVRKARVLFWTGVGGFLLVREGIATRPTGVTRDQVNR